MPEVAEKKSFFKSIIRILILILCIGLIIQYFYKNNTDLALITQLNNFDLIRLIIINALIHICVGIEIYFLLRKLNLKKLPWIEWFNIYSATRFLNIHIAQGGNLYRSVQLKNNYNFSYTKTIAFLFLFSILQIIYSIILALIIITFFAEPILIKGIPLNLLLIYALIGSLLLTMLFLKIMKYVNFKHPKLIRINEFTQNFVSSIMLILKDPKFMLLIIFFNGLIFFLTALQVLYSMEIVGIKLSLLQASIFIIFTLFSGLVNITPANLGITEFVYGFSAQYFGSTLGKGVIAAGIMRIINYVVIMIFAVVCYGLAKLIKKHPPQHITSN